MERKIKLLLLDRLERNSVLIGNYYNVTLKQNVIRYTIIRRKEYIKFLLESFNINEIIVLPIDIKQHDLIKIVEIENKIIKKILME